MGNVMLNCFNGFPAVRRKGTTVRPFITLVRVKGSHNCKLSLAGDNKAHLSRLREAGAFTWPKEVNSPAEGMRRIKSTDWIFHDAQELFKREIEKHMKSGGLIITNAGNAPLHDWEVNYSSDQEEPLSSRDWEMEGRPMLGRVYYCATYAPGRGVNIGYVRFTEEGHPRLNDIQVAVGGRPLVHDGNPVSLEEFLKTSITDPRHLIMMPEMDLGNGSFMPLGLRTIQQAIREYDYGHIVEAIKKGTFVDISLDRELGCCPELSEDIILKALNLFGYGENDYQLDMSAGVLRMKLKLNPYRHTFWAKKGYEIFIGIISNDLQPNDGVYDDTVYRRVLKPTGLTIPELQAYLVDQLQVEEAVLMGNGKDARIYAPQVIGKTQEVKLYSQYADSDTNKERDRLTGGLISLVIDP